MYLSKEDFILVFADYFGESESPQRLASRSATDIAKWQLDEGVRQQSIQVVIERYCVTTLTGKMLPDWQQFDNIVKLNHYDHKHILWCVSHVGNCYGNQFLVESYRETGMISNSHAWWFHSPQHALLFRLANA